ncbi:hypothetical protein LOK49_LG06G02421, partial [Camellia lanceoleosa]
IVPEIKVDKERLAANDAKEDFWQAITKLKSLETSFKKNLNDGGNKSSWCEEGFFEEEDSLLFFEVPLSSLVEQQPPTAKEAVDDGDHGGGSVADSNG